MKRLVVGVDWGHEHIQFVAVDDSGKELWKQRSAATGKGLLDAIRRVREVASKADTEEIAVVIEQRGGRLVDRFLESGFEVWFCRPGQVDQARALRFSSKAKDDLRDARVMAWMLRTMPEALVSVEPSRPTMVELQRLTRVRSSLVKERSATLNRVTGLLREVFPEMLVLSKPETQWFRRLWRLVRTPEGARAADREAIAEILRQHRVKKHDTAAVEKILRAAESYDRYGDWTLEAELAMDRLDLEDGQIQRLEKRIDELMAALNEAERQHREGPTDAEIVRSLPGVGATLTAVMVAERLPELVRKDRELARALSGVAPVLATTGRRQTAGQGSVVMRRACNGRLRDAVHLMVEKGLAKDEWLAGRYAVLRARNRSTVERVGSSQTGC